jgi:excisionase family DNA binding protein
MPVDTSPVVTPDPAAIGALYTPAEVAKMMRVGVRAVQYWIRNGELPALRYGRSTRIRQADLMHVGMVVPHRSAPAGADAVQG